MKDNKAKVDFEKIMGTAEGKQLLKLLTRDGGTALKSAGAALQQGNEAGAMEKLSPLLEQGEVKALLERLNQTMGHG